MFTNLHLLPPYLFSTSTNKKVIQQTWHWMPVALHGFQPACSEQPSSFSVVTPFLKLDTMTPSSPPQRLCGTFLVASPFMRHSLHVVQFPRSFICSLQVVLVLKAGNVCSLQTFPCQTLVSCTNMHALRCNCRRRDLDRNHSVMRCFIGNKTKMVHHWWADRWSNVTASAAPLTLCVWFASAG